MEDETEIQSKNRRDEQSEVEANPSQGYREIEIHRHIDRPNERVTRETDLRTRSDESWMLTRDRDEDTKTQRHSIAFLIPQTMTNTTVFLIPRAVALRLFYSTVCCRLSFLFHDKHQRCPAKVN